jgi:hypothetical protein
MIFGKLFPHPDAATCPRVQEAARYGDFHPLKTQHGSVLSHAVVAKK